MKDQFSIAVLPFVNMSSSKENEYFSDGITEEIINALTKINGLNVTSRTSSFAFKNTNVDVRSIASQLNVATILEGSIRKAKNKVRITAQLIRSEDGFHLFSENFDRELKDVFALQEEVSVLIADQIRENFGHIELPDQSSDVSTDNVDAYNDFLKGRFHQVEGKKDDLLKAAKCFEQSIEKDPKYSEPYLRASQSYAALAAQGSIPAEEGLEQAGECMLEGSGHDKDLSYKCYVLSSQILWAKWDFKKAYYHNNTVIKINPSFSAAHKTLAEMYAAIGDFDKAMDHSTTAISIDPISPGNLFSKGNIYYLKKDYSKAIEFIDKILLIDPNWLLASELKTACQVLMNDPDKLEAFLQMKPQVVDASKIRSLYKVLDFDIALDSTDGGPKMSLIPWQLYLEVYKENYDLALDILEEGIQYRIGQFINFRHDPFLLPLHQSDRFQKLIDTIFDESKLPVEEAIAEIETAIESKPLLSESEMEEYKEALDEKMEGEKLYLSQDLSLRSLADELTLHPNKLSWLLNEHHGKNFNEYINTYRLEDFKSKAQDSSYKHLTLLGMAYESGFQSKSVFNAFFKKSTGTSPRTWLKSAEA